jgi:hypothetical protein
MKRFLHILAIALLPLPALADFQCDAQVKNVLIYSDGSVNVKHSVRNDYTMICNLKIERLGVSTETCSMWTAMLLNFQKNASLAQFYYSGTGSCATLPVYSYSPAPLYIGGVEVTN